MSTLLVTIEQLIIHEHPNADALELAQVGLFRAVVPKGVYKTGDFAVYVPEQSVLPDALIEELGLVGRLAGKAKNRVTTVRLRGEISQGIVCRPELLSFLAWQDLALSNTRGINFAVDLGITKWVPPIPPNMDGEVEPAPDLLPWVDIENIKRYPNIFEPGEKVHVSEKVHGTCCLFTYDARTDRCWVSSKGYGAKNLAIVESPGNLYWRAIRQHKVLEYARWYCRTFDVDRLGIYGEVYGAGVQDLHYGKNAGRDDTIGYAVFDIAVASFGLTSWLPINDLVNRTLAPGPAPLFDHKHPWLPTVHYLWVGPYDEAKMLELAEGPSQMADGTHVREGIVVRPYVERYSEVTGGRAIGKVVGEGYLTRGGKATEFE